MVGQHIKIVGQLELTEVIFVGSEAFTPLKYIFKFIFNSLEQSTRLYLNNNLLQHL